MQAGAALSTAPDPARAIDEAAGQAIARGGLGRVDFALVLVTGAHGDGISTIAERASRHLDADQVVGASVEGLIAAGVEVQSNPGVAVLALQDCCAEPFLIEGLAGDPDGASRELGNRFGGTLGEQDLVVLLPDPLAVLPRQLLSDLESSLSPARVVGGASGGLGGSSARFWLGNDAVRSGALAGFVLRGAPSQVSVTQSCHFMTQPLEITRSRGNWIHSIAGRPALDVYRDAAKGPLADDLRRAQRFVMVAVPDGVAAGAADFALRHVVGFDERSGAISLPEAVASGTRVRLALLDAASARQDLGQVLDRPWADATFGLYFNCRARGESLFGVSGLEAGYLERQFGSLPIVGTFGAFQIAPRREAASHSQMLTYAGVLTLVAS